jgi:hypothetical protein
MHELDALYRADPTLWVTFSNDEHEACEAAFEGELNMTWFVVRRGSTNGLGARHTSARMYGSR